MSEVKSKVLALMRTYRQNIPYKLSPLLFFENHLDASMSRMMKTLLPFYEQLGYKVFCFEHDNTLSLQETLDMEMKAERQDIELLFNPPYRQGAMIRRDIRDKTVSILTDVQKSSLQYQGIDPFTTEQRRLPRSTHPSVESRNKGMAKALFSAMEANGGGVIGIFGNGHFGIQEHLLRLMPKNKAQQVLSFCLHSRETSIISPAMRLIMKEEKQALAEFPMGLNVLSTDDDELCFRFQMKQRISHNHFQFHSTVPAGFYRYEDRVIEYQSTCARLSSLTGVKFSPKKREGAYIVDAIAPRPKNFSPSLLKLYDLDLIRYSGEKMFIEGVNISEVAETIWKQKLR